MFTVKLFANNSETSNITLKYYNILVVQYLSYLIYCLHIQKLFAMLIQDNSENLFFKEEYVDIDDLQIYPFQQK